MVRVQRQRTLTIADAMTLLAALAIGLISVRKYLPVEFEPFPRSPELIPNVVSAWAALLFPGLEVGTLAIALLTLRHPRPPLKRLTLRPGFVACGAAAIILSIGAAVNVLYLGVGAVLRHWPGGWVPYQDRDPMFFSNHVGQISYAVVVCWAFMAAGGRWRPEPQWVDRLGRGFGFFWVGVIPIYPFLYDRGRPQPDGAEAGGMKSSTNRWERVDVPELIRASRVRHVKSAVRAKDLR